MYILVHFLTASFLQGKKLVSVWNYRHPCRITHTVRNIEHCVPTLASGLLFLPEKAVKQAERRNTLLMRGKSTNRTFLYGASFRRFVFTFYVTAMRVSYYRGSVKLIRLYRRRPHLLDREYRCLQPESLQTARSLKYTHKPNCRFRI